jgi:hypothetical protein
MNEKTVISISRTKDLVRCAPGLLTRFLRGETPVRFARLPELHTLELDRVGALALWTKDPANLCSYEPLRDALTEFRSSYEGAILLNLTVTGLGGTVLEPGIPGFGEVAAALSRLLAADIAEPEAVILRYDPLIEVQTHRGPVGNIDLGLFKQIAGAFASLGVRRIKISPADYSYAHIARRLARAGIEPGGRDDAFFRDFLDEMKSVCDGLSVRLDVCCHPIAMVTGETAGCIDGALLNGILAARKSSHRVTEEPHNSIGRQRKSCRCTYSRDIGYSPGIPGCFASGGACLYCYSQRVIHTDLVMPDRAERSALERSA